MDVVQRPEIGFPGRFSVCFAKGDQISLREIAVGNCEDQPAFGDRGTKFHLTIRQLRWLAQPAGSEAGGVELSRNVPGMARISLEHSPLGHCIDAR